MTKTLIFILLFNIISIFGFSQLFNFGIKGGFVFSQIDGDDLEGFNKLGLSTGFDLDFSPKKDLPWDGTFGMQYNNRGSRLRLDPDNPLPPTATNWEQISLHYLDILLGLRYKTKERFSFSTGLYSGILFSERWRDLNGGLIDGVDAFKRLDLGSYLQMGYSLNENMMVSLTYNYSILRINDSKSLFPGQFIPSTGMRNNFICLHFSYYFQDFLNK